MDKNYKLTFRMDTYVQGTLILLTLGAGIFSLLDNFEAMLLGASSLFLLGVWQVSSGLLFSVLLKDKKRALYLCSVLGFFFSMYLPELLGFRIFSIGGVVVAFSLMGILSFYYFSLTIKDMVVSNSDYLRKTN